MRLAMDIIGVINTDTPELDFGTRYCKISKKKNQLEINFNLKIPNFKLT